MLAKGTGEPDSKRAVQGRVRNVDELSVGGSRLGAAQGHCENRIRFQVNTALLEIQATTRWLQQAITNKVADLAIAAQAAAIDVHRFADASISKNHRTGLLNEARSVRRDPHIQRTICHFDNSLVNEARAEDAHPAI